MIHLPRSSRTGADSIVPMINVAFLLLVFFLMTAVLAPSDPFEVTPPVSDAGGDAEATSDTLLIGANGDLALGSKRGEAVFEVLPESPLRIRADASLEGATLAGLLDRLARRGVSSVELITVSR